MPDDSLGLVGYQRKYNTVFISFDSEDALFIEVGDEKREELLTCSCKFFAVVVLCDVNFR